MFDDRVCLLGEGPFYDDRSGLVGWVDILGRRVLWRTVGEAGTAGGFATDDVIGAAVPSTDGGLVLCLREHLELRRGDGSRLRLAEYPLLTGPPRRSNDAKADPGGRLWHGTMAFDLTPGAATLYRLDPQARTPRPIIAGATIANGLGWSPDASLMYFVDTPTRRIDMFDYDLATGLITRRRPFAEISSGPGLPDGLCVDAEGGIWVALWGGAAVHRYTPQGRLDRVVGLPTPQVTSCAFAGPDLDVLIITTASEGRPDDPAAGRTYVHQPDGVIGRPVDRFAASVG